jgi:hypothetical protein
MGSLLYMNGLHVRWPQLFMSWEITDISNPLTDQGHLYLEIPIKNYTPVKLLHPWFCIASNLMIIYVNKQNISLIKDNYQLKLLT